MLERDLREFIELLNSQGVEYLIVGGHAVAYHGYPRFTGDMDFFVRMSAENAAKILKVLSDFGFPDSGLAESDFQEPNKIIQLGFPPNRIDLITSISGVTFEEAWANREAAQIDGLPVHFPGLQDLIRNKKASGRAKDLGDLDNLVG